MTLLPPWDAERDDTLVCVGVRQETHDVRSFVFRAEAARMFRFLPGQFMTLELEAVGQQRCYTIASPPTRPYRIEITAKRSGTASTWLHDHLHPGMRLRAAGPMGDFSFGDAPQGKYLFLAAGSGITPLMSMARAAHDLGAEADIVLLQSARTASDLLFAGELATMTARSGFRALGIVETDAPSARWNGFRGRLSAPILQAAVPDLLEREVFCCGPAPYMASVRALLTAAGFDLRRYREESFAFAAGEPDPTPPAPLLPGSTQGSTPPGTCSDMVDARVKPGDDRPIPAAFSVVFAGSGRTIACPAGTTVLAAARAAGLRLPSACQKGVCGTCKSRMSAGTVEMRHGGGIRQREIDAGMVLLCCAIPTSDLVVER